MSQPQHRPHATRRRSQCGVLWTLAVACMLLAAPGRDAWGQGASAPRDVSTAALLRELPGFESGTAQVNGIRIHYVAGGRGEPLFLLPGWPQTWWQYNRIMPALARDFRVVAVDLRGMGGSSFPAGGYDKKTMARDVFELARALGYRRINIAGHDIGSMVAQSFAFNYPEATIKLALLDVPHPDQGFAELRMLPELGKFGDRIDEEHPGYPWWFAFHQVRRLPEEILAGRYAAYQDSLMNYLMRDPASIPARDRAVYHAAYASRDAFQASMEWYRAFPQDIVDIKAYPKLTMPVLGLGATGYGWLQAALPPVASDFRVVRVPDSGHFVAEENPDFVIRALREFFR